MNSRRIGRCLTWHAGDGARTDREFSPGDLGSRVVRELLARRKPVRALVRAGTNAHDLQTRGVEVVRGDMLDSRSLDSAMAGTQAVITTAIGYSHRKKGDSLKTDLEGNRNLIDAAKRTGVPRFVLTSILQCDLAINVPHFWAKKEAEDHLERQGVPFVALRPGAYLGGGMGGYLACGLRKGTLMRMTPPGVRITYIHPDEVARALAIAVDEPRALNRRVDLGSDRARSTEELAEVFTKVLGRPVKPGGAGMLRMFRLIGRLVPGRRDFAAMFAFFATGKYIADTTVQGELLGPVPRVEDAARKLVNESGVV